MLPDPIAFAGHPQARDDPARNEPGRRGEPPTNRLASRTADRLLLAGGSAERAKGRHHLRCEPFLLLVAPPADPKVEDREPQVEGLECSLDDLVGFARDPSFGIFGRRAPIRALTLYAYSSESGSRPACSAARRPSSIFGLTWDGGAGPIEGIQPSATRPVSSSAFRP